MSDLQQVQELIRQVISNMKERGNEQWNDQYPKPEIFEQDIKKGHLYAMMDGKTVIGIIVLTDEPDEMYEGMGWTVKDGKLLIGHRIAVLPSFHCKGIAKKLMDFMEEHARKNGYSSIRLDTYHKNDRSQAMLLSRGYRRIPGHINFPECSGPYYCYELILKTKRCRKKV